MALCALVLVSNLREASAQSVQCPATPALQVKNIAPYAPDGDMGLIRGFAQAFSPRRVRLVNAWLGLAADDEAAPSVPLEPDDLMVALGRRAVFTLWNGVPPRPEGVLHLVCEYEGGLVLNRAVGTTIRRCELTTQLRGKGPSAGERSSEKVGAGKKDAPDSRPRGNLPSSDAAKVSTDIAEARSIVVKAVVNCR